MSLSVLMIKTHKIIDMRLCDLHSQKKKMALKCQQVTRQVVSKMSKHFTGIMKKSFRRRLNHCFPALLDSFPIHKSSFSPSTKTSFFWEILLGNTLLNQSFESKPHFLSSLILCSFIHYPLTLIHNYKKRQYLFH